MDYAQELKELLRPLGIYDLEEGAGARELEVTGGALDGIYAALLEAEREGLPLTAGESGLAAWEALFPFVPAGRSPEDRRAAVAALLRIDGASFTPAALNSTLAGCGIPALTQETGRRDTVAVSFPGQRGVPADFDRLKARVEQILPCHLAVEYRFTYALWQDLEAAFADWQALEEALGSWEELESWSGA